VAAEHHGVKSIIAAFFANLGIAVAKFVGFLFTGSASMLAESIHSVADTGNQGLLLLGGRMARRRATEEHQFGFGRERYFWAFVVALVLFSFGSLFSLVEGIDKLRHPHAVESLGWALAILGLAMVFEGLSFRTAMRESRPLKGSRTWWGFIRTARVPELPVVLLEDSGALVGLSFAFVAVTIAAVADAPVWDAIGTLCIGALLGVIAVVLAVEMKGLLIGESALPETQETIRRAVVSAPHVVGLIHLRTQYLGPDELLVGVKVAFDPTLTVAELAVAINQVEANVRAEVPIARPMYVEPDVLGDDPAPEVD
jgi:cation diffusion facilitator family transporter